MNTDDRAATAAAIDHLRDALRALVRAAEGSRGARCPHRTADDACTYPAGCENQRPDGAAAQAPHTTGPRRCAGDDALDWDAGSAATTP